MGAGGQWAAGEGVVDGAHGFRVVKISSGFRCAHFSIGDVVVSGAKTLTHYSTKNSGTLSTYASSTGGYMKMIWHEEDNLCVDWGWGRSN